MDPREVLGVSQDAGEEEIRAAYVRKVKEHPPDRSPEEFERIRNAYEDCAIPADACGTGCFPSIPLRRLLRFSNSGAATAVRGAAAVAARS